jgi:hypothetical protein
MVQQALPGVEEYEKKDALTRTPMQLIDLLVEKGGSAEQLAVLFDIQLKWEANESRKKFEAAFEHFKRTAPEILKTKKVSIATRGGDAMEYSHAELHKITEIIGDSLRSVGIIHQWKTSDANGRTTVTCVLKGFGHTEEAATLSGPSDTSGGKNNIQAIGSTVTYLQRYTLLSACGLAAKGTDNDGKTEGLPEDTITDYVIQMQDCSDFPTLKGVFAECYAKAKKADDRDAKSRFEKVYNECKKNLIGGRQ